MCLEQGRVLGLPLGLLGGARPAPQGRWPGRGLRVGFMEPELGDGAPPAGSGGNCKASCRPLCPMAQRGGHRWGLSW